MTITREVPVPDYLNCKLTLLTVEGTFGTMKRLIDLLNCYLLIINIVFCLSIFYSMLRAEELQSGKK